MSATGSAIQKFNQWLSLAWRNLQAIRRRYILRALVGRNATIAYGAAIVVALIWIFNTGVDEVTTTKELLEKNAPPQSSVVGTEKQSSPNQKLADADTGQAADPTPEKRATKKPATLTEPPTLNPQYQESVEVDVSAKSVAITAGFSGQRIVVFGAVHKSLQVSAEQELYDVVVVLEGAKTPLVTRKKSNVAGLWVNTESLEFSSVPSYYTISSTRPIAEISTPMVFDAYGIGFQHVRMEPRNSPKLHPSEKELQQFRDAIIRLKEKEGLYQRKEDGVVFIGSSLFRTSIDLPANVPIGNVIARTYLFRDAELIALNTVTVALERQGIEALLHDFAFDYPLLYGIFAVFIAVSSGLLASAVFNRGNR